MKTKQEIMSLFKEGRASEFLCAFKQSMGTFQGTIIGETFEQAKQIWAANDEITSYTQDAEKLKAFHIKSTQFFNSEN